MLMINTATMVTCVLAPMMTGEDGGMVDRDDDDHGVRVRSRDDGGRGQRHDRDAYRDGVRAMDCARNV